MMQEELAALRSVELFAGLSRRHLELIARVARRVELETGEPFITQGQNMTHLSVVISGSADVLVDDQVVAAVGAGDVLGELSLIDEEKASATVIPTEPTAMWLIARAGFVPVWENNRAEISTAMLMALTKKLRETNRRVIGEV